MYRHQYDYFRDYLCSKESKMINVISLSKKIKTKIGKILKNEYSKSTETINQVQFNELLYN